MRTARFRIELPPNVWIGDVSRAHPDAVFRLLAGIEHGDRATELGEIRADPSSPVVEAFRRHPAVASYEALDADGERSLARYEVTDRALYRFLRSAGLPPEFPIRAEDGGFEIEVTAEASRLRSVREELAAVPLAHEVLFVAGQPEEEPVVTDRQREALEVAFRQGYFTVPREAKLADVAEELGVDASTASGVLRRAEARVVDRFLAEPARRIDR